MDKVNGITSGDPYIRNVGVVIRSLNAYLGPHSTELRGVVWVLGGCT